MHVRLLTLITLLSACSDWSPIDQDGDGLSAIDGDCWDAAEGPVEGMSGADIFPGAPDAAYDGVDADCGGDDDYDADGDGYVPTQYVGLATAGLEDEAPLPGGDCQDDDPAVHPGAEELCNAIDDDCNNLVDDEAVGSNLFYADTDGDNYGDPDNTTTACTAPDDYVSVADDCDDGDAAVNPGAREQCNGIDDDCDDAIDEDGEEKVTWYSDGDGDGYASDDADGTLSCASPGADHVLEQGDCDDGDAGVYPDADESCDGIDEDCDDEVDEDAIDATDWYPDADADGYGSELADATRSCSQPADTGWVDNRGDCDDTASDTHPGASETCDLEDDDCDGEVDEDATDGLTAYDDDDGDGFGDVDSATSVCELGSDQITTGGDCDDGDPAIHPDAEEVCNELDDNCDGTVDDDATDRSSAWTDGDGDGFGDPATETLVCDLASDQVDNDDDCDDADAAVNPDAEELCNETDDDCDDSIDEEPSDGVTAWTDDDGDGFGDAGAALLVCELGSGIVDNDEDCDDSDAAVSPDAVEVCNDIDDDCNDVVDDGATDTHTVWADTDGDGFGDPDAAVEVCTADDGQVDNDSDCDDDDAFVNPNAVEVCNGIDDDCDDSTDPDFFETDFLADPSADVQLNGDAEWTGGVVRLNDAVDYEAGSLFLGATIPGDTWQVSFRARIWDKESQGADGFTFAFLDESMSPTWLSTADGGGLGVAGADGYVVEFDTYDNDSDWWDDDGEHIAVAYADDLETLAQELSPPNFDNGSWFDVVITYEDGDVTVEMDGGVELEGSVAGTPPENWRMGFTAATGGVHEKHAVDDIWIGCP